MKVNLSKINLKEPPVLFLKNQSEKIISPMIGVMNFSAELNYNEISQITFDVPFAHDGKETPYYKALTGFKIIEWQNVGRFQLVNPSISGDGLEEIKSCMAYSLEYEFVGKKISLEKDTYNFYNPVAPKETVLGIIMERMPSWKIGEVDSSLWGKYRTFEINNQNLLEFMKNDLQETYNCIFEFDTFERKVYVRDANKDAATVGVYLSTENLIKKIEINENSEDIVTVLDVNGADGVNIRSVNPLGTNKIYNLDYFMTSDNVDEGLIERWNSWKTKYEEKQSKYFNLTMKQIMLISRIEAKNAELADVKGKLKEYEALNGVHLQALAQGIDDGKNFETEIKEAKKKIASIENEIESLKSEQSEITVELKSINTSLSFSNTDNFSEDEQKILDRFFVEDSIEDSNFVSSSNDSYNAETQTNTLTNAQISVTCNPSEYGDASYTKVKVDDTIYIRLSGGEVFVGGVKATVKRGAVEYSVKDKTYTATFYLGSGEYPVEGGNKSFNSGNLTVIGKGVGNITDTGTEIKAGETKLENLQFNATAKTTDIYFTNDLSQFEQKSVEWDLFEYGKEQLERVSAPKYDFSVSLVNFLELKEFEAFKKELELGEAVYMKTSDGVIKPIVLGVKISDSDISDMDITFGSTFDANDATTTLKDLVKQSISMGKTVDYNKYSYSKFIDSGADTSVKSFMNSALDVAKNAILSSSGQDITWDKAGFRLRKMGDNGYDNNQIWMLNNSIMFTNDGWQTVKMAIGETNVEGVGKTFGIVADAIVGKLIAGNNLVIESLGKENEKTLFKVDGSGALLYNSQLEVTNRNNHILLNPTIGFAIGKYPVVENDKLDENKAQFWIDTDGNVHMKGTLEGATGTFTGNINASTFTGGSIYIAGKESSGGKFEVDSDGNVTATNAKITGVVNASEFKMNGIPIQYLFGDTINTSEGTVRGEDGTVKSVPLKLQGEFTITDGINEIGKLGFGTGSTSSTGTTGVLMSREGGGYVICTEAGTRMQLGDNSIYVDRSGTRMQFGNNSIYVNGEGFCYQKSGEDAKPIGSGKAVFG